VWAPSSRVSLQSATEARVRRETVEESGEGGGGLYLPLFGYHQYQDLNDYENYDDADELKATLELEDDLYGDEDDSFENNTST
jgi:hypothetical protein